MNWHVFCRVIDNHGDLGVCWRLARALAAEGETVSMWVDDTDALAWMAPEGAAGVTVLNWRAGGVDAELAQGGPVDVLIEAFGCEPAPQVIELLRPSDERRWINLEYLSAEAGVERLHGLPSPVSSGAGAGSVRHFFYPGFTERTGGLLRERGLLAEIKRHDDAQRSDSQAPRPQERVVTLFCYEPAALAGLLRQLAASIEPVRLIVSAGRAAQAVRSVLADLRTARETGRADSIGNLQIEFGAYVPQPEFDRRLWSADLNLVRGEDSLVRALWAGKPFVWQIYPQDDGAHHVKLDAFLDWLDAPSSLRRFHRVWNGSEPGSLPLIDARLLAEWRATTLAGRARLLAQDDLVTQLRRFVRQKR